MRPPQLQTELAGQLLVPGQFFANRYRSACGWSLNKIWTCLFLKHMRCTLTYRAKENVQYPCDGRRIHWWHILREQYEAISRHR